MVSSKYLLRDPGSPSTTKRVLDQRVIPLLIDSAGGVEVAFERVAVNIRRSPAVSMCIALGIGALLSFMVPGRRRAWTPNGPRR